MSYRRLLPSISFLKADRRITAGAPHPLGATWDGRGTNFALFSSSAEKVMLEIERDGVWSAPLVTELEPLGDFYPAEEYHRDYYRNNPNQGYCRVVIEPKVAKVRKQFRERLKRA